MANSTSSGANSYLRALSSAVMITAAQASKILVGFAILKLVALYLGPDGLGKLGHFMSLASVLALLAGGGISHGVIKYCAEYKNRHFDLYRLLSTSTAYAAVFAICSALIFLVFSGQIAGLILGTTDLAWIISGLSLFQFVFAFNILFSSFANGLGDVKSFAITQTLGNIISLPIAWFLIANYGMPGAALSIVTVLVMAFFPSLFFYFKSPLRWRFAFKRIDSKVVKRLSWFGLMLCVSAIAFPIVEIYIRQGLIESSGYTQAGMWQGVVRLSSAYLGFFSVFLASYFMPMVSATDEKKVVERLAYKFVGLVMVVFFVGGAVLYFGRSLFIPLLLSGEFLEIQNFIIYQLVGDFFKASAYVIGFVAVAKAATKVYIISEVIQAGLFVGLNFIFGNTVGGAEGVTIAYMCACIIYFIVGLAVLKLWVRN